MDNEDEEASQLTNPCIPVEDDPINVTADTTTTTPAKVMDSIEAVQGKTEPQPEPGSAAWLRESLPPPTEKLLGYEKEVEEDEIARKSEAVAEVEVSMSELVGAGGDSRDSKSVGTAVVGEEDGADANTDGAVNAGGVVVGVGVGEGDKEDVIGEGDKEDVIGEGDKEDVIGEGDGEREKPVDDVAEGIEEKADVPAEMDAGVDVAEGKEIVDEEKGDDVAVEVPTENERKVDDETEGKEILGEQKGDDVAVELLPESGTKVDDLAVKMALTENEMKVVDVTVEKAIEVDQKGNDVVVDPQIEDVMKLDNVAEETGVLNDLTEERPRIIGNKDSVNDSNMVDLAEETETMNEARAIDVAVDTGEGADIAEDNEIVGGMKIINVAEDKEMAKEINVADLTETSAAAVYDMEVGDVTVEMEMQEEGPDFTDVDGGGEEVEEPMEKAAEATEIVQGTGTDKMEMGDVGEETMEAGGDIEDEREKAEMAEEMETGEDVDVDEVSKTAGGKRKRIGKKESKSPGRAPSRKKSEDVCFICFDGGELVLCDRRGCPKAYHPSCVNRDEAFFRAKGRWNCGWHLCSICEKNAYYMCYTCTFSLCKGCTKDAIILCVRGNKGFCETCMKTVMLIERNEQGSQEMAQVDFDDKTSWEYLFKDYWLDIKGRLSLSSDDVARAKNPWKGSGTHAGKQDLLDEVYDANIDRGHGSESSFENVEAPGTRKRKAKKRSTLRAMDGDSSGRAKLTNDAGPSTDGNVEWASKELLEFVMHMRNGDKSVLSQFDVQTLLLEYIKKQKLRDPQRRTHVICDARLQSLFGKSRVGHFEMLKLLESHFLVKEDAQVDGLQGNVVDTEANQLETDGNSEVLMKGGKDKRRKTRKKRDHRGLQSNIDDYAAIDLHNINLIYLRRSLVEELLGDTETFHDKVVGTFARIRISGSVQKQDIYRLVQVTGTSKCAEPYKVGKRTTDFLLEILNLNKTEVISIDIVSNQEFSEDECRRLRQSIKCGLINRLTVGDIQEKTMALQEVRVKDWMEAEILRLSHLRDRASDLGRRKELRECVEKLQILKTPEERQRRLEEIPEIHSDPNMDPSYESEEEDGETYDKRQENYMRPRGSSFSRRGKPISPGKGGSPLNESLSGARNYSGGNKELTRNMSDKGFSIKGDDSVGGGEIVNESLWTRSREKETQQLNSWDRLRTPSNLESGARSPHPVVLSESISMVVSGNSPASANTGPTPSAAQINESEKVWHYQDPSGKVQGPFCIVQLRKWNNTGYFPANLRIWRSNEKQDDSILLSDALAGKFHNDPPLVDISLSQTISSGKLHVGPSQQGMEAQVGGNSNFNQTRTTWNLHDTLGTSGHFVGGNLKLQPEISSTEGAVPSHELPKQIRDGLGSETNLPSPTPTQNNLVETRGKAFEKEWSPTPNNQSGSVMMNNLFPGGNGGKQSPTVIGTETGQLAHFSTPSSASKLNVDGLNVSHGSTSAYKPELGESHMAQVSPHQLASSNSVVAPMNPAIDMKIFGASLQTLVQSVSTHITPGESHGRGSGLSARPDMMVPPKPVNGSQGWGNASSQKLEPNNPVTIPAQSPAYGQPYASAFNPGNLPGVFTSGLSGMPSSDSWRPPFPNQSNIQPPAQPITPWGMGVTSNQSTLPRQGAEHQNMRWGQMPGDPSMGWVGQLPASTNVNWAAPAQGQAPGNSQSGWVGPAQSQAPKNAVPGWAPPGQGPFANPGWVAPGQGPPPGNGNPAWGATSGNPGMWGGEQNNGGDRFGGQRDRGSQGGDSGYGGGRPWNRQPSIGGRGLGDPSRPLPNNGQRVCKFHEGGHCKKGSQCDYLHT